MILTLYQLLLYSLKIDMTKVQNECEKKIQTQVENQGGGGFKCQEWVN